MQKITPQQQNWVLKFFWKKYIQNVTKTKQITKQKLFDQNEAL